MPVSQTHVDRVIGAARLLPRAEGTYLENDFVITCSRRSRLQTTVVVRALEHFKTLRWAEIRTMTDLKATLARYPNDKAGNTDLAQRLWGYNMWTRAGMLRCLVDYFDRIGVCDQPSRAACRINVSSSALLIATSSATRA